MVTINKNILLFSLVLIVFSIDTILFFAPKSVYAANIINFSLTPPFPDASQTFYLTGTIVSIDNFPAKNMEIIVDGSTLKVCNFILFPDFACTGIGGPYSAGNHTLTVNVTDNLNNTFSSSMNFNVRAAPFCGDGLCNGLDTCGSCSQDCGGCPPSSPPLCSPSVCPGGCADAGQSRGCGLSCPNNSGISCNDSNACTASDTCDGGVCSGSALICNDNNVCTNDSCNPAAGCVFSNNTAPCDDGKNCTSPDNCSGGICSSSVNCATPPNNKCYAATPGTCDTSWNCSYTVKSDNISCDTGIPCLAGYCQTGNCVSGGNVCGGLVPCGRLADNPATTEINESKPCDLCSAFYMLKKMLNFAIEIAAGIAVFVIVIGGLLYAFSAGNPGNIEKAKSAITNAIMGLAIMFISWLIVALILNAMGYADITNWNQVNCALQR